MIDTTGFDLKGIELLRAVTAVIKTRFGDWSEADKRLAEERFTASLNSFTVSKRTEMLLTAIWWAEDLVSEMERPATPGNALSSGVATRAGRLNQ